MSDFILKPPTDPIDLTRVLEEGVAPFTQAGRRAHPAVVARVFQDQLIRAGLLVPEIQAVVLSDLTGAERNVLSYRAPDGDSVTEKPYWSTIYGGSGAIMHLLLQQPYIVRSQNVLDLGCGSGMAAVAAAICGARSVTAWDMDPISLVATAANARLNRVSVATSQRQVVDDWPATTQVVLAGDVLKEGFLSRKALSRLGHRINQFRIAGGTVVVADSDWRASLPQYAGETNVLPSGLRDENPDLGVVVLGPRL